MKHPKKTVRSLALAAWALTLSASANWCTWIDGGDGSFDDQAMWVGNLQPAAGDMVQTSRGSQKSVIRFAPSAEPMEMKMSLVMNKSGTTAGGPAEFEWDARGTTQRWYGFPGSNFWSFRGTGDQAWFTFNSGSTGVDDAHLLTVTDGQFYARGWEENDYQIVFKGGVWDLLPSQSGLNVNMNKAATGITHPIAFENTVMKIWGAALPSLSGCDYTITLTNSTIDVGDNFSLGAGYVPNDTVKLVLTDSTIATTNVTGTAAQPRFEILSADDKGGRTYDIVLTNSHIYATSLLFGGWNNNRDHDGQNYLTMTLNGNSSVEANTLNMSAARVHSKIVLEDESCLRAAGTNIGVNPNYQEDDKVSTELVAKGNSRLEIGGTLGAGGYNVNVEFRDNASLEMGYLHTGRGRVLLADNAHMKATRGCNSWIGSALRSEFYQTGGLLDVVQNNTIGIRTDSLYEMSGGRTSFYTFLVQDTSLLKLSGGVFEVDLLCGAQNGNASIGGRLLGDGGTVKARSARNFLYWLNDAQVNEKGLTIDTGDLNVLINQAFTDARDDEDRPVDGRVVKTGAGALQLYTGSTHAVTAVAQGTLIIPQSVETFGRTLVVTNNAVATTKNNQPQTLKLEGLVLGDGVTRGTLELDANDTIELATAEHVSFNGGFISVPRDLSVNGTFTLLTVKEGAVTATQFAGLKFVNAVHGKTYTIVPETDAGTGVTTVKVAIDDFHAVDAVWTGAAGNTFTTAGSWENDNLPTAETRAIFGEAAAGQTIAVPTAAAVNSLEFDAADVTLAGTGPLAVEMELAVAEGASATLAVPLASSSIDYLQKTGTGALTLSGDNAALKGDVEVADGFVDVTGSTALGSGGELVLAGGTLRYAGDEDATIERNVRVKAPKNLPACVEVPEGRTLTLKGAVDATSGLFAKFGAGTLVYEAGAGNFKLTSGDRTDNGSFDNSNGWLGRGKVERAANGSQTVNDGIQAFSVLDGTLRLKGVGEAETSFTTMNNIATVGGGMVPTAPVELVIDNCSAYLGGSGIWFCLGADYQAGAENAYPDGIYAPTVTVVNGGVLKGNCIGAAVAMGSDRIQPLIHVVNGSVEPDWETYLGFQNSWDARNPQRSYSKGRAVIEKDGRWLHACGSPMGLGDGFEVVVRGGLFGDVNSSGMPVMFYNRSTGTISVSEGGAFRVHGLSLDNYVDNTSVVITMNDGTLDLVSSGEVTTTQPDRNRFVLNGAGMRVTLAEWIEQTIRFSVTGAGALVKSGVGALQG